MQLESVLVGSAKCLSVICIYVAGKKNAVVEKIADNITIVNILNETIPLSGLGSLHPSSSTSSDFFSEGVNFVFVMMW